MHGNYWALVFGQRTVVECRLIRDSSHENSPATALNLRHTVGPCSRLWYSSEDSKNNFSCWALCSFHFSNFKSRLSCKVLLLSPAYNQPGGSHVDARRHRYPRCALVKFLLDYWQLYGALAITYTRNSAFTTLLPYWYPVFLGRPPALPWLQSLHWLLL